MADKIMQKQVIAYAEDNGREPFTEWLNNLRDSVGRNRIRARLFRLEQGHYGDCKLVGEGAKELRMFFGSGYRIYFGEYGNNIIILLCGGDKDSQDNDIQQAKVYWRNALDRSHRDA